MDTHIRRSEVFPRHRGRGRFLVCLTDIPILSAMRPNQSGAQRRIAGSNGPSFSEAEESRIGLAMTDLIDARSGPTVAAAP